MFKRRTILVGLTALGLTLALSTQVYGQSTSGPEAWEDIYNESVAGATTIVSIPLLGFLLSSILQIFFSLTGFWGG